LIVTAVSDVRHWWPAGISRTTNVLLSTHWWMVPSDRATLRAPVAMAIPPVAATTIPAAAAAQRIEVRRVTRGVDM
jgi:hypothetical protein